MKSLFKKVVVAVGCVVVGVSAFANSVTTTIQPNGMVSLLSVNNSTFVSQIVVSANSTNASVQLIDTPTNQFGYAVPAYTNTISWATNVVVFYTNFYGTINSNSYTGLVDYTNNVVAATTNSYPVRASVAALAGSTATVNNFNTYFRNGIWATNNSAGIATVTLVYTQ